LQLKKGRADGGNNAVLDADEAACGCKYPGSERFGTNLEIPTVYQRD
jgi:hypothetical protein